MREYAGCVMNSLALAPLRVAPRPVRDLVHWLARTRNQLAHLEPLRRADILQGLSVTREAQEWLCLEAAEVDGV